MSTHQEREEDLVKGSEVIKLASGKNKEAAKYLHMIGRVWRVLDDIYDTDYPVTREDMLEIIEYLFIAIPSNRFFIQHSDKLTSQHITAYNAWMAANKWTKGNLEQRVFSHVWRGDYQAVIGLVALLTQGIEQMKLVDEKVKETFGPVDKNFNINNLGE
tara:strand:- start:279 stop:755 length:477 start_codon:yes stop_codon:yes gene_type:complete